MLRITQNHHGSASSTLYDKRGTATTADKLAKNNRFVKRDELSSCFVAKQQK
jgi:hypothetical protein